MPVYVTVIWYTVPVGQYFHWHRWKRYEASGSAYDTIFTNRKPPATRRPCLATRRAYVNYCKQERQWTQ